MENLYKVGDVVVLSRNGLFGVINEYRGGVIYFLEVCYPDGIRLAGSDWYYGGGEPIPSVWSKKAIIGYASDEDRKKVCNDYRHAYATYYDKYNREWYEKYKDELEADREDRFGGVIAAWKELGW